MGIFDKIKQLREQRAQRKDEDVESYVDRSYADMFNDYKEQADKDAKNAAIMQTLSSGAQFMANSNAIDRMKVTRTPNVPVGQVSLSSFDMRPQATRKLDQSFNSMINLSRKAGQKVDPVMLSKYSDAVTGINSEQARLNNDVRNQERLTNFQSYERTKELNAANEARYNEATDKMNLYKLGMGMDNTNKLAIGLANINNITMSHKANVLSAEAGFKQLQDENDLTNRLYPPVTGDNTKTPAGGDTPPPADPSVPITETPTLESIVKPSVMPSLFSGQKSFDISLPELDKPNLPVTPFKSFENVNPSLESSNDIKTSLFANAVKPIAFPTSSPFGMTEQKVAKGEYPLLPFNSKQETKREIPTTENANNSEQKPLPETIAAPSKDSKSKKKEENVWKDTFGRPIAQTGDNGLEDRPLKPGEKEAGKSGLEKSLSNANDKLNAVIEKTVPNIIQAESSGDPNAQNPYSTATGLGQFDDSTWMDMMKSRPDLTEGKTEEEILDMRTDPELSKAMTKQYAINNAGSLERATMPVTPGNLYAMHHLGPTGGLKVLKAPDTDMIEDYVSEEAYARNPWMKDKTIKEAKEWFESKAGGTK